MVASKQRDHCWVFDFEAEQKGNCLNRIVTTVHEVTDHHVLAVRDLAAHRKHFQHIVELAMHVACNHHRGFDWLYVRFFKEDLLHLSA